MSEGQHEKWIHCARCGCDSNTGTAHYERCPVLTEAATPPSPPVVAADKPALDLTDDEREEILDALAWLNAPSCPVPAVTDKPALDLGDFRCAGCSELPDSCECDPQAAHPADGPAVQPPKTFREFASRVTCPRCAHHKACYCDSRCGEACCGAALEANGGVVVPEALLKELLDATDDMARRVIESPCLQRLVDARAAVLADLGATASVPAVTDDDAARDEVARALAAVDGYATYQVQAFAFVTLLRSAGFLIVHHTKET